MSDDSKLRAYLFTVEIDGIETARFQKCEGLEAETYVYEIEEGGLNHTTRKFRGRTRFPNLILEKGITENDSLFNWFKETCLENKKLERKNGSVVLKDTEGNEVKRWNFFRIKKIFGETELQEATGKSTRLETWLTTAMLQEWQTLRAVNSIQGQKACREHCRNGSAWKTPTRH